MNPREQVGRAMAATLNRYVAMDPEARRKLRKLEGRRVAIGITGPEIEFALTVDDGRFRFGPVDEGPADAWLRASPGAFLALGGSGGQAAAGQIELSGDTETARRFQQFFTELKPDFEESMSQLFGDVLG
ncbi:MAG: SCP2 sterol-binding domain-containing protein, partial [Pseudomonadota bacterium]